MERKPPAAAAVMRLVTQPDGICSDQRGAIGFGFGEIWAQGACSNDKSA